MRHGDGNARRGPQAYSANPLDGRQRLGLAVVADFHGERENKDDASRDHRKGQSYVAIRLQSCQGGHGAHADTITVPTIPRNRLTANEIRVPMNVTSKTRTGIAYQRGGRP
jgi:hypothetical protein